MYIYTIGFIELTLIDLLNTSLGSGEDRAPCDSAVENSAMHTTATAPSKHFGVKHQIAISEPERGMVSQWVEIWKL